MNLTEQVEVLVAVLVVAVVAALLVHRARRHVLVRPLGSFDCALRMDGERWAAGVARYQSDRLDWFRTGAVSWRPAVSFRRGGLSVSGRQPARGSVPASAPDAVVASCRYARPAARSLRGLRRGASDVIAAGPAVDVELAMAPGAYTGLASWLESAPPGDGHLPT